VTSNAVRPKIEIWHIAIPVSDLGQSERFYRQHLGFELAGRDEYSTMRQTFVSLGKGGFTLELFVPLGEERDKPRRYPDHVAFEVADLASYRESIATTGLSVPEIKVFPGGMQHFAVNDPDGVRLDFFQGREA
jgi:catechol 2,3-dioxygenase-like lactoylglutathione lyase family enzyme